VFNRTKTITGFFALSGALLVSSIAIADVGIIQPELEDAAQAALVIGDRVKVIAMFDRQPDQADLDRVVAAGGDIRFVYSIIPGLAATIPADQVETLANIPGMISLELDMPVQLLDAELDNGWGVKRIGAGYAHDQGFTGAGVKVAVLDTGIDYNHPEFDGIYAGGFDFQNNDSDPMDDHDHGTHVSGTIAAAWDGVGVVGVAPGIQIYACKVLNASGSGDFSTIIAALEWCVNNDIDVTNQSLGSFVNPGSAVESAYDNAAEAGIYHAAASGNFFGIFGIAYPARFDSVVATGATEKNNKKASFTDTGPQLELAAPGVDVLSCKRGGGYIEFSGTSMASPHVAGTAALVFATGIADANGNGRINDEVRARMNMTAIDLGNPGRDTQYGFGLVNAQAALHAPMTLTNDALVRGTDATLTTVDATPGNMVYFAYGFAQTTPTHVDALGVVLALKSPLLAGSSQSNAMGVAELIVEVPATAPVGNVWLQSVEFANTSSVVADQIQ